LSNPPTPSDQPSAYEINRQNAQRAHDKLDDFHKYVNEAAIKTSELALRMALLINGGAAIALLTFVGTLPKEQKRIVADTLLWFAYGVATAAVAIALAYFTNYFMAGVASSKMRTWEHPYIQPGPKTGLYMALNRTCHIAAVICAVLSLAFFVCGVLSVRAALTLLT
jgi:hypothetical protein